ncbi:MAG: hypothetical protein QOG72_2933 [Sphingomonadales bacterium]|jgi:hypothetical protein|nr:hypothetical protein [Sphingomonadales bacterium]
MSESAASLRALAYRCRQAAAGASLDGVAASLNEIAHDYERQADRADRAEARTRDLLSDPPGGAGEPPARRR